MKKNEKTFDNFVIVNTEQAKRAMKSVSKSKHSQDVLGIFMIYCVVDIAYISSDLLKNIQWPIFSKKMSKKDPTPTSANSEI